MKKYKNMQHEKLITENINLIYYVLKKYHLYGDLEEYFDIGMIELVKCAKNYDESKGYKPSTFLTICISRKILTYIRNQNNIKRGGGVKHISIYTPINNDGKEMYLLDTIPSNENIEESIIKKEQLEFIYKEIFKLKERDKFIICSYYELLGYEKLTQQEIATATGTSQSHVNRKIKKIIEDIRRKCEENNWYSDIRNANYLKFYVENHFIYVENSSGERLIIADLFKCDSEEW